MLRWEMRCHKAPISPASSYCVVWLDRNVAFWFRVQVMLDGRCIIGAKWFEPDWAAYVRAGSGGW